MMLFVRYIPFFLQAFLLWLLFRRRAYCTFPFFFAYTAFGVAAGAARFVVHNRPYARVWTYWSTDAVYILLGTLALFEVFQGVFRNVTRVWWRYLLFPAIIAAGVFLSIARMQAVPPQVKDYMIWIITGQVAVRVAQVITFAALASLTPLLSLRWPQHSIGIAAGFGMYATIMLLMTTKLSDYGASFEYMWGVVSLTAYDAALLIWMWSFRPSQSSKNPPLGITQS